MICSPLYLKIMLCWLQTVLHVGTNKQSLDREAVVLDVQLLSKLDACSYVAMLF